jgi:enamine deaminase RidA (YjgF/YER057c/UK114 family)
MTTKIKKLILLPALFFFISSSNAQTNTDPEVRIKELGIRLSVPATPIANYVAAVRVGKMIYLSGQGPHKSDGTFIIGKVGAGLNLDQAQAAARLTGICLLEALRAEIGSLNKVKRIVKVLGMVNAIPSFEQQSQVINGFSDLMVEVFGDRGKHARSAIGVASLPMNIPIEIEMIVELK